MHAHDKPKGQWGGPRRQDEKEEDYLARLEEEADDAHDLSIDLES